MAIILSETVATSQFAKLLVARYYGVSAFPAFLSQKRRTGSNPIEPSWRHGFPNIFRVGSSDEKNHALIQWSKTTMPQSYPFAV